MELKKLDIKVLTLWYIRAAITACLELLPLTAAAVILVCTNAPANVALGVMLAVAVPVALLLALTLLLPYFRYKQYAWGYDEKTIVVYHGVIFRKRVVIPVCQIQDLHRKQGPIMQLFHLSDVTVSTAGSNFDISTLTTVEADAMLDALEKNLEKRIEELKNEEI